MYNHTVLMSSEKPHCTMNYTLYSPSILPDGFHNLIMYFSQVYVIPCLNIDYKLYAFKTVTPIPSMGQTAYWNVGCTEIYFHGCSIPNKYI